MHSRGRGQSNAVGVALLTAVVVVSVGVVGVFVLDSPTSSEPVAAADVTVSARDVEVVHAGGDSLALDLTAVVVDGRGARRRLPLDAANLSGDGDDRFEPGETWSRTHGLGSGPAEVLLVWAGPDGSAVLDEASVTVPTDSPPSASLSYSPSSVATGETVTFDASGSTDDGAVVTYRWDWDDDGTYEEAGGSPTATHAFSTSGPHPVAVEVEDAGGAVDRATVTVAVGGDPTASFTVSPATIEPGGQTTVDASGSDPGVGSITSYEWDWTSDGTYDDAGVSRSKTYGSTGSHQITLRVTTDAGQTDAATETVTVTEFPEPSFTYSPATPLTGESVTFDGSASTDADGSVTTYEWDWDGDGTYEATGETATHSFASHGSRDVTLRVTDDAGASETTTQTVSVEAPPTADFTWQVNPDDTLTLDGGPSTDPDGTIVDYEWEFSNTAWESSGETTTHDIESEGDASTVTLTVTDDDGHTDSVSKQIPHTLDVGVPGFGAAWAVVAVLAGAAARRRGYL